ncbi:purine-cytosine permease family protein [Nocardiopsis composta]|uniref:NCS1 family nucleobase:cation symporter-1 n=1 Tax=Nocardiopsis composta TaxID=157465 RepID=A0A7W8QJL2_9ACTN|nr:cytosine permease [Nocardiopsis composta]MBB5430950.1 NCS1 family nucleobase:cation symporter-1 [Nocardiopsis composta]
MLPLTIVTGAVGTGVLGLPFGWAVAAIVAGNLVGGLGAALHAAQGPHLGIPQMLQARAQFGYHGGSILALIALLMFLGFFASNLVVAAQSFAEVVPGASVDAGIAVCTAVALIVAVFGYDLVRKLMAAVSVVLGAVLLTALVMALGNPAAFATGRELAFTPAGFCAMVAIGAVWQLAYAPYVSDYSRYLPERTGARPAFWATYSGLVLGTVLVMVLGALVGLTTRDGNAMGALGALLGDFGPVTLAAFGVASAVMNSSNIYSGVMCSLTVLETVSDRARATTGTRVGMTAVYALLAMAMALFGQHDFLVVFKDFVAVLLYVLIPWSAINLVDYFVLRKGDYAVADMFARDGGRYGRWDPVGLACYAIGLAVQVPFMATSVFTGPLVGPLGGVDVAWIVGLAASAGLYLAGRRAGGNRPARAPAAHDVQEQPS